MTELPKDLVGERHREPVAGPNKAPPAGPDFAPGKPYLRVYLSADHQPFALDSSGDQEVPFLTDRARRTDTCSRRNPLQEGRRVIEQVNIRSRDLVVILGAGNPQLLSLVGDQLAQGQLAVLIDCDFRLAALLTKESKHVRAFLEKPGRHFFGGEEMLESLWTYFESLPAEGFGGIRFVSHAPSVRRNPEFFSAIEERLRQVFRAKMSDLLTRFEFEQKWIRNILINTNRLIPAESEPIPGRPTRTDAVMRAKYTPPTHLLHWQNVLNGRPALLVAAGPSLRESLEMVRTLSDRCFVMVCDTALKVLLRADIVPHAVVTLDAQKHTLYHFLGERALKDIVVFADIVVHPLILRNLSPKGIVFSTTARHSIGHDGSTTRMSTPGTEYAEQVAGELGDVQSGGSVATSAFEILRTLGAGPILFVGQDLAYTGREIHSTGTHHNERWVTSLSRTKSLEHINEAVMRKRQLVQVEAIGGGSEPSDYVLQLYRHWFEDAIPRTGHRVWNLTRRGARINGVPAPDDVEQLVESLPPFPEARALFDSVQTPLPQTPIAGRKLYADLKATLERLDQDLSAATEFFEAHPELKALSRQSEAYVRRNREKLDSQRADQVMRDYRRKALLNLERGLRAYLSR